MGLLVLSRKQGEGLVIGDDIHISVAAIQGNKVRLAIDAPGDVEIVRDELISIELAQPEEAVA